jgi:hypothetical protein
MSDEEDEFKDVIKGLPSETAAQRASIKYVSLFTLVGVIIAIAVLGFGKSIVRSLGGHLPAQIFITGMLALLVGGLQAMIFRSKIRSRLPTFIAFSLLGGIAGGLVGGILMAGGFIMPLVIGALNGFLAGAISSLAQNRLMENIKYSGRWFLYNAVSWAIIFAIGWLIGWQQGNLTNVAIAGAFIMIASGISLVVFLRGTPQIEFS